MINDTRRSERNNMTGWLVEQRKLVGQKSLVQLTCPSHGAACRGETNEESEMMISNLPRDKLY